jgi:hypothetical protein
MLLLWFLWLIGLVVNNLWLPRWFLGWRLNLVHLFIINLSPAQPHFAGAISIWLNYCNFLLINHRLWSLVKCPIFRLGFFCGILDRALLANYLFELGFKFLILIAQLFIGIMKFINLVCYFTQLIIQVLRSLDQLLILIGKFFQ